MATKEGNLIMIITDDAKRILEEMFVENNADCLIGHAMEDVCGVSMAFSFGKTTPEDTDPILVNGIKVFYVDDLSKTKSNDITLDLVNGHLHAFDANPPVSSGCGCGGGGCGCGC